MFKYPLYLDWGIALPSDRKKLGMFLKYLFALAFHWCHCRLSCLQIPDKDLEVRRLGQRSDPISGEIYIKDVYAPEKPPPVPLEDGEEEEEEEEEGEEEDGPDEEVGFHVNLSDTEYCQIRS